MIGRQGRIARALRTVVRAAAARRSGRTLLEIVGVALLRVAALYDVHGNLPALEAVLAEVEREGVDAIVVGGDIAAGPPQPREVVELAPLAAERAVHPRQRRPPLRRRVRRRRRA